MKISKYENAFGIKEIKSSCDLSNSVIYASNGVFKSSFARSLYFCANGESEKVFDRLTNEPFSAEISVFNKTLTHKDTFDNILVYSKELKSNKEKYIKQLVTNAELQTKLEIINKNLNFIEQEFNKCLASIELKKSEFDIIYTNGNRMGTIRYYKYLIDDINNASDVPNIDSINFKKINSKAMSFIDSPDIRAKLKNINNSIQKRLSHDIFDEDFNDSTYDSLIKAFNSTNFLNENKKRGVKINDLVFFNINEFTSFLNEKAKEIVKDPELQKVISEFEKSIGTSKDAVQLKKSFEIDPKLYSLFSHSKREIVLFVLKNNCNDFVTNWIEKINNHIIDLNLIYEEAKKAKSTFEIAIEKYKNRFSPIFDVVISNKTNALVDGEFPEITFIHKRNKDMKFTEEEINGILSSGEKSALEIIGFIVEYEYRKQNSTSNLLLIFDDIVETFDYSNRAGFIEYVEELINLDSNKMIILTHNYEFYLRIGNSIKNLKKLAAYSNDNGKVQIEGAKTIKNEYKSILMKIDNYNQLVASVALSREIIELTDTLCFEELTKFLHYKKGFEVLLVKDLIDILENKFHTTISSEIDKTKSYYDVLTNEININTDKKFEVIPKMAISIACRVLIEKNIIKDDFEKLDGISSNQTREIQRKYSPGLSNEKNELLNRVLISTPEFIHVNSFMVEPLVDIDPKILEKLYIEIKSLD